MIHIESSINPVPVALQVLDRAARLTLKQQAVNGDVTIVLTDDEQLQRLNHEYLGIDLPTDVLSFPASETDPDTGARYLGDILLSIPRASEQARAAGHPLESETQLLVVHGVLHLLGFDHADPDQKRKMWASQAEVLRELGLSGIRIQE